MATRALSVMSGTRTGVTSSFQTTEKTSFKDPNDGAGRCVQVLLYASCASAVATFPTVTHPELGTLTRHDDDSVNNGLTAYKVLLYVSTVDLEGSLGNAEPFTISVSSGTWDITYAVHLITGCDESYNGDGTFLATTKSGSGDNSLLTASFTGGYIAQTAFVAVHYANTAGPIDLSFASPWHKPGNLRYLSPYQILNVSYGDFPSQDAPMLYPQSAVGTFLEDGADAGTDPDAWVWMTVEWYPQTYGSLPPLSSDVPFLSANDRYQVVAMPFRGSTTTIPEFRMWYAGAPLWNEELAFDTHIPNYHATDELPYFLEGSIEYPFKEMKVGQAARIDGVLVEFSPRPADLNEDLDYSTPVGFSGRVEAHGLTDYSRDVTNVKSSGVLVSDAFSYTSTIGETATDAWPNIRTVYLPVRLQGRVRAFRVVMSGIHMCAIRRVQVLGKQIPLSET